MASELKPCGGCGATSDRERCIGCLHDFGTPESAWVRTELSPGAIAIGRVFHGDEGELDDLNQSQIKTLNIAAAIAVEAERTTPVAPVSPDATGKCGELVTVAWQRKHPTAGWMDCGEEYIPHYRDHGQEVRELSSRSQAVELLAAERVKLTKEEADHTRSLEERDRYHDVADKLAHAIADRYQSDIGEHSSINDPWQNALNLIEADNAALTAEISAISGHLDCEADSDSILHTLREIEADKAVDCH